MEGWRDGESVESVGAWERRERGGVEVGEECFFEPKNGILLSRPLKTCLEFWTSGTNDP